MAICCAATGATSRSTSSIRTASPSLLDLVASADALIEGFRPGVMERLGVGPDVCLERNPKLVFGRMTGWGQDGPYAQCRRPRHQLHLAGRGARPLRARRRGARRRRSTWSATSAAAACSSPSASCARCSRRSAAAQGQVVDAAMVDGAAVLMTMFWALQPQRPVRREPPRHQPARHRRPLLRRLRVRRRRVHLDRIDRAAVLRRAAAPHRARRRPRVRQADGPVPHGRTLKARLAELFAHEDTRRMVRDDGAHRRLLRAGAHDERGAAPSPQRRPRRRSSTPSARCSRRRRRASAARRPNRRSRLRMPASTRVRCCSTGASHPLESRP